MKTLFALAVAASTLIAGCASTGSGGTSGAGGTSAGTGGAKPEESGGATGSSMAGAAGSGSGNATSTAAGGAAGPAGSSCQEATAATDCASGHTCADWGAAGAPDLRCTRNCDYWANAPGCEGDDLCLPSNLCVPPSIIQVSKTYSGACDPSEEGVGCRAYGGKLGGMCFRLPWENWPMCSEFCRPIEGFGSPGSDCASFQKCQPVLLDDKGVELQTLGLCV